MEKSIKNNTLNQIKDKINNIPLNEKHLNTILTYGLILMALYEIPNRIDDGISLIGAGFLKIFNKPNKNDPPKL